VSGEWIVDNNQLPEQLALVQRIAQRQQAPTSSSTSFPDQDMMHHSGVKLKTKPFKSFMNEQLHYSVSPLLVFSAAALASSQCSNASSRSTHKSSLSPPRHSLDTDDLYDTLNICILHIAYSKSVNSFTTKKALITLYL
jgi:hypothetical protein